MIINEPAIERWVTKLRHIFPGLDRFDRPDPEFDEQERDYKVNAARKLRAAVDAADTDQQIADAIWSALSEVKMIDWRASEPMGPNGTANKDLLWPALRRLVKSALGDPRTHHEALAAFCDEWRLAVPDSSLDPARQIAGLVLLTLSPQYGVYIRHSVRQDLWLEAVGRRFDDKQPIAEVYRSELQFMQAVRQAFDERGLAPRDMIDVQGALWVVHNYPEEEAESEILSLFTREAIEAAMDAYDEYRGSGEHAEKFGRFSEPRDYWVRSTKTRSNRVYPTKPIVGFIRNRTELNGGWGRRTDAAALLHNAGYIIVDKDDNPVEPPDQYEHLKQSADRIRLCGANYYVGPARDDGLLEVSIRSGDLSGDMGLRDKSAAVCSALGGRLFQSLAGVRYLSNTEPNPSSTTVFTYRLGETEELESMDTQPPPVNLILYGPPGTGKTFATAWEAVRLCVGSDRAERLIGNRDALMSEYHRLANEGRIEFVTFHQSSAYEDFVEGLRPTTETETGDDEQINTPAAGGFSLKARPGVFKTLSERARLDTGGDKTRRLDRSRRIYKIALGQRGSEEDRIQEGLDNSLIHIGWGGDIDWSDDRFDSFEEIRREWNARQDPDASGKDPNIEMTFAFRSGMQIDDYVVVSDGRDVFRALGKVTGEYEYHPEARFHPHRRTVEWLWRDDNGADRSAFYPKFFRRQSAYRLDTNLVDWDALETIVFGADAEQPVASARPFVLVIDEINRANISKVFGELITLLEDDKRLGSENELRVRLPYSGASFGVPSNLHIIGTMNTADRSIALLDTALRRRFTFHEMMPAPNVLREAAAASGLDLPSLLSTLNERIEYLYDREHQIGHAYFTRCASRSDVDDVMRHKVIPLLAEYFFDDWEKIAIVLGDGSPVGGRAKEGFLRRVELRPPPGVEDQDGMPRYRWQVRSEEEGFDYSGLLVP